MSMGEELVCRVLICEGSVLHTSCSKTFDWCVGCLFASQAIAILRWKRGGGLLSLVAEDNREVCGLGQGAGWY